jgi:hypothetical protein
MSTCRGFVLWHDSNDDTAAQAQNTHTTTLIFFKSRNDTTARTVKRYKIHNNAGILGCLTHPRALSGYLSPLQIIFIKRQQMRCSQVAFSVILLVATVSARSVSGDYHRAAQRSHYRTAKMRKRSFGGSRT